MRSNPYDPTRDKSIANKLIGLVPNWYRARFGDYTHELQVPGQAIQFCSHRPLPPSLDWLLKHIQLTIDKKLDAPVASSPSFVSVIQEHFALEWLNHVAPEVKWWRFAAYLGTIASRTSENSPISTNIIVSESDTFRKLTRLDKDDPAFQKVVNQLGSSPFTYIRVDRELNYIRYDQIPWSSVMDHYSCAFYPQFLHAFHSEAVRKVTLYHDTTYAMATQLPGKFRAAKPGIATVHQLVVI
jgi:hypothetical protein